MIYLLVLLFITLTTAKQKTFAEMYQSTMNDNNGRVTYDGETGVLVLFYLSKDQNMTKPTYGHPFIVPNDQMTKLKINNFYDLIQKMEKALEEENTENNENTDTPTTPETPTNPETPENGGNTETPSTKRSVKREDTETGTQTGGTTGEDGTQQGAGTTGGAGTGTTETPEGGAGNTGNEEQGGATGGAGTTTDTNPPETEPEVFKGPSRELYCRILVNYRYSEPIKVLEIYDEEEETGKTHKAARFPKFVSVRTELDKDSRVESVQWDHDSCETCNKNKEKECFDNFCTFTDSHYGSTTCAEAKKKDKSACGLIIYFGWKGPAHAGFTTQYLKSYRNLPTHYTKYSKDQQFVDAAADIESDWFSF